MEETRELLRRRNTFLLQLEDELRLAEDEFDMTSNAALQIQRLFRGSSLRSRIIQQNYAAVEIQRVFRGYCGRGVAKYQQKWKLDSRQMAWVHLLCIQVQRCFRGYYSRKYKQCMSRRRKYCQMLSEKSELMRQQMSDYAAEQMRLDFEEQQRVRREEFTKLARNMHHLTSTRQIRGVYNPLPFLMPTPTVDDIPVEEHIRGVVKDLLRTRGGRTRSLVPDVNGTLRVPLAGQKYRLSVQASAPYDAVRDATVQEKILHKILVGQRNDFLAGGKSKILEKSTAAPLAAHDEPFMDSWANPVMVKGVPESQKQLHESVRLGKALFATGSRGALGSTRSRMGLGLPGEGPRPFVSAVGGNLSSTMANNLFDVIAEAQETGGAIHRHRGVHTSRFGLASSMDARSAPEFDAQDTTIPRAPYRTSARLKTTSRKLKYHSLREVKTLSFQPHAPQETGRIGQKPLYNDDSSSDEEDNLSSQYSLSVAVI